MSFKEWPRIALGWFLMLACLGFSAANAVILSRGAARWADSGWEKAMYGGIAGIVPFLIAIIPLVVWYSWRVKRRGWAIAASCVYVVFLAYNLIGAGGAIAMVRADAVSARKFDAPATATAPQSAPRLPSSAMTFRPAPDRRTCSGG